MTGVGTSKQRRALAAVANCKFTKDYFFPTLQDLNSGREEKPQTQCLTERWEALYAATSPAALRHSLAELSTPACLLAQIGGLSVDVTGVSAPGSGHTLSCGWRAEQHSF